MKVFYGLDNLPEFKHAVLTTGTYDGVHFGHQQIIKRLNELATNIRGESILLTFDPHPRLILNPGDNKLKLISTIDEKIELLASFGLQNLVIAEFSKTFSDMPAEDYVRDILVAKFHPQYIVVGHDHRFGKNRTGDIYLLEKLAVKYGYQVEELPAQSVDEISVSSTKVRNFLLEGNIKEANQLLLHPFSLTGKVIHGDKVGRILGFPTANIDVSNAYKLIPASGVYVVKVDLENQSYFGALSIGYRESVFENSKLTIEVFILDYDGDLYNKELKMVFVDYLRPQIKYENWELLKIQIEKDVEKIRKLLSNSN